MSAGFSASANRVTSVVYDGVGHVTKRVAHLPPDSPGNPERVQITQYIYSYADAHANSSAPGDPSDPTATLVASNGLLYEVRYPDETTGQPSATAQQLKVRYSYNGLGELRSLRDQNQTCHVYERDALGRGVADHITAFGTDIDTRIARLGVTFDTSGRLDKATSYTDAAGTTVADEVRFRYTPLGQVRAVYQDHDGPVQIVGGDPDGAPDQDTQLVSYGYATVPASGSTAGSNYSRVTSLTYPDGTAAGYSYGSSGSPDERISHLMAISGAGLGSTNIVEYGRIGLGMLAFAEYPAANVQLDRTVNPPGQAQGTRNAHGYHATSGIYPGYDRWGRVITQAWVDGKFTTNPTSIGFPNIPPLLHERYTYDKASSRIGRSDIRPGVLLADHDEEYGYDGLDRLTEAKRGVRNPANQVWTWGAGSQQWDLDLVGNWLTARRDLNANGSYTDTNIDEQDTRLHNAANEITQRTVTGPVAVAIPATPFAYDDSGNLRTAPHAGGNTDRYTHDAWNRLVQHVLVGGSSPQWTSPIATYQYNALHWRTVKQVLTLPNQTRLMYYSASWQLIEEHIHDSPMDPGGGNGTNRVAQEFWGLQKLDDPVMRRIRVPQPATGPAPNQWAFAATTDTRYYHLTDPQGATLAMTGSGVSPTIMERVRYTAYGVARHRWGTDANGDGASDSNDKTLILSLAGKKISEVGYRPDTDLNRDGVIDSKDVALLPSTATPPLLDGLVSDASPGAPDNVFGYDGYVFNGENRIYVVRFRCYDPATGRWLERDPLGYLDGGGLYAYCRGNPSAWIDSYGLFRDWFDRLVDFGAGAADSLTFGVTDVIRSFTGLNDVVDHNSTSYVAGEVTEVGVELVLTVGSSALKESIAISTRVEIDAASNGARQAARKLIEDIPEGAARHHDLPLVGHPFDRTPALFPTAMLPTWLNTNKLLVRVLTKEEHRAAHEQIKVIERFLRLTIVGENKLLARFIGNALRHVYWYPWSQSDDGSWRPGPCPPTDSDPGSRQPRPDGGR
jgi:RHS repeat-associated protein